MNIDFSKGKKLVPAVIQDASTNIVLMLGYMNEEAYQKTIREHKVTFYSRSKKHLWTKGETSGNYLYVKKIMKDCDSDTLLIKVNPAGPVCHTGADTCFAE
ncbi:phosphoribosyl-AMP cyclohydrolase, partial [Candidatus Saccharibacteria bacterium]|nr:phosphoribosyl-AMP cyclohydrolase [Candidatus Saccharibacteria bacterium]NIW80400.1 phosphoribosyl-AMP cyclohydrolase [Calditrichia bacterium]